MKKRIAIISEHASPLASMGGADCGGQNVYVSHVARLVAQRGFLVDVFTRRNDPSQPEIVEWAPGTRVIHVNAGPAEAVRKEDLLPHMTIFTHAVLDFMRRDGHVYDLCHAHFFMSGLVAADMKRLLGTPFIVTFHALGSVRRHYQKDTDEFPPVRLDIERKLVDEADRIIAECPQDMDDLVQHYNADPARIRMVPCGFEPREFRPISKAAARRALGLRADEKLILQLGRLVPRKGIDNVIRGFAIARRRYGINTRLMIVGGNGPEPDPVNCSEMGRLMDIARRENISEHVLFTGSRGRDKLHLYYNAADIFITTPWYEPFGITPLEAMACGTPVIGSAVGGIKYSIVDGETGLLVPPQNPEALAERIAVLYNNPEARLIIGKNARRRVNSLFTWKRVAKEIGNVYSEVLARKALPHLIRRPIFKVTIPAGGHGHLNGNRSLLSMATDRRKIADRRGAPRPAARWNPASIIQFLFRLSGKQNSTGLGENGNEHRIHPRRVTDRLSGVHL